jgi:hypothetical protein
MVAAIPRVQSAFKVFMNAVLICLCCPQMFELFHTFIGFITYIFSVLIFSCMLFRRQEHT